MSNEQPYIYIDGSYFCFYRYHALLIWWKNAFPEDPIIGDPFEQPIFVEKFKKLCIQSLQNIPKKLGLTVNPLIYVGKDCKRSDIWRIQHYAEYKSTRQHNPYISSFFKLLYDEPTNIFMNNSANKILSHPHLEADDCIAISVKKQLELSPSAKIYIITSDKDYLQLAKENVQIFNLTFKNIGEQKNAEQELFCKIIMGDNSDNISGVLKKCGPKTALKCFENPLYLEERIKKENASEKWELNKLLVDFNNIPAQFIEEFLSL